MHELNLKNIVVAANRFFRWNGKTVTVINGHI